MNNQSALQARILLERLEPQADGTLEMPTQLLDEVKALREAVKECRGGKGTQGVSWR